jgi:hypothetical protein
MESITNIVSQIVSQADGKTGEQVTEELDARLEEAGHSPLKVVKTGNIEKERDADCPNAYRVREEYKVDHGDGTFSDPWWGPWECL